jgi:hypothetical protein
MTILFDTDEWIVLTRAPFAFGPFDAGENVARTFAERVGGIALTWHEPEWVCESYPPDFGAVWFNGDWENPFVVGPFYDSADAAATYGAGRNGFAVELDEFPEEHDAYPEEHE